MNVTAKWPERLEDGRGKEVIFLAHCILNENTRYLGGAARAGAIREIVQPCIDQGLGIVQLPCPEQHAWGGVLKRRLLRFFGAEGSLLFRLRGLLLPLMIAYTRHRYRRLARDVAGQIEDYLRAGYRVRGIVGVDGSPSCGVLQRLNMRQALTRLGTLDPARATAGDVNAIVVESLIPGPGMFTEALAAELRRRRIVVPMLSHSLVRELAGTVEPLALGAAAAPSAG